MTESSVDKSVQTCEREDFKMEQQKELTGYPSIDKHHYKFYRETPIREIEVNQTIYELVFKSNAQNMAAPALEYMGVTWTFEKLKEKTDSAAVAFAKSGLKMGDTVLVGLSNCPEIVVILLALNKIGVISKWFDIRAGEIDIQGYVNDSNCRYLIGFDILLPRVELIIEKTCLEKVLVVYPSDSLSITKQFAYEKFKANKIPKREQYVRFKDFLKKYTCGHDIECAPFDRNRPSVMIQSSGTTGKPKTIVHSDFSVTSCTNKIAYSDIPFGNGKDLLVLLPPWIAYGLGNAIILPMALGSKIILSPTFDPDAMIGNLGDFVVAFAAPIHYRYLRDNYNMLTAKQREGIGKIECLVSGGDKISVEENKELEKIFGAVLINGYGSNEGWGALTVNPMRHNKYGTVGIPKYGETVIAFDNESAKELKYGEIGEICALTDTMFLYYDGNFEETKSIKQKHSDGNEWLHTGDIGFVDEEGFVTLCGRARRVIVWRGFKISAYTIEDNICEHPLVKECVAVEVDDVADEHVPMAYIVLKDNVVDVESAKKSIYEKCRSELKEYEIPRYFQFVSELPYTQNGKYDFRALEERGNIFVKGLSQK